MTTHTANKREHLTFAQQYDADKRSIKFMSVKRGDVFFHRRSTSVHIVTEILINSTKGSGVRVITWRPTEANHMKTCLMNTNYYAYELGGDREFCWELVSFDELM